jgi:RNA polymerase sigma-70 factor, ECF subfamily
LRSDEALYEALVGGELRAFDELYERYERPLFGFIRRQLADEHDAEDVLHEAFLTLFKDREATRAARSLRAWLYQVTRNLCLNRERSRRRASAALQKVARAPADEVAAPERALEQRQIVQHIRDAVGRLPTELAELYQLRARGMSYEEMADVLAVPLGTVKSRMHQMVALLREETLT